MNTMFYPTYLTETFELDNYMENHCRKHVKNDDFNYKNGTLNMLLFLKIYYYIFHSDSWNEFFL